MYISTTYKVCDIWKGASECKLEKLGSLTMYDCDVRTLTVFFQGGGLLL